MRSFFSCPSKNPPMRDGVKQRSGERERALCKFILSDYMVLKKAIIASARDGGGIRTIFRYVWMTGHGYREERRNRREKERRRERRERREKRREQH